MRFKDNWEERSSATSNVRDVTDGSPMEVRWKLEEGRNISAYS